MNKRQQERLDIALQYTKQDGCRHPLAIVPAAGKIPIKGTEGYKSATTDPEVITKWWSGGTYNIAAATGEINDILVIDVDEKPEMGKYGFDSLRDLEEKLGKLPDTWEAITGSGGRHLYFRYPKGHNIKSSESLIAEWIDVKAQGGIIILPPSIHPKTHKPYEWEASGDPSETPLADLPDKWLQKILEVQEKNNPSGDGGEKFTLPDVITTGQRNRTLYRYACSLRGKKTPPVQIFNMLMQCNSLRCQPPLSGKDIETIYNSALKHEEGTPTSKLLEEIDQIEQPDLRQFHFFNKDGAPSSVYDLAIFEYLVQKENIFVLGGVPYIYKAGVYEPDVSGAHLKTAIRKLIYPELVKSPVLERIYKLFLSARELQVGSEDLNSYPPHWINFQNGFYDPIDKKMIPHDPKCRAVNQIPHEYHAASPIGEKMESWLQFIVPDADNREMLLGYMGYCLTRDTRQQRFLILCGSGGTGKSTVIRLLEEMIGHSNISNVSLKELTQRFASYALLGKLVNSCADLEVTALEDTSIVKKISGEDAIRSESKGKDAIFFHNYARMIFSTNQMPLILSEQTNGFWRRLMILSMNRQPEHINPDLVNTLLTEIDYLIHLSVQAVERMYETGRLTESAESKEAVQNLWCDSDSVESWIRDACSRTREGMAERVRAYQKYDSYCSSNGRTSLNRNNFYRSMRSKGFSDRRSNGKDYFKGISLEKTSLKLPSKLPCGFVSAEGVADNPFV